MNTKSFAVVETNSLNFYIPATSFVVVKHDSPYLYSHLQALR